MLIIESQCCQKLPKSTQHIEKVLSEESDQEETNSDQEVFF